MKSTAPKSNEARIRELLLLIGGLEESLRLSIAEDDKRFSAALEKRKHQYYQELKRAIYGLPPEQTSVPAED